MSATNSFMSLPAELRLDIYERVLQFECPLRRIKTIEDLDGTIDDELRQYVRGGPADISILFACRKTFDEALPILYKHSKISLCHDDVCIRSRELGFTRYKPELLTKAVVFDLERFEGGYAALGERLLEQGVNVTFTFTAPGHLTMSSPVTVPRLDFRLNVIAATWAYYSTLPAQHIELHRRCSIPTQLMGINKRFVLYIREILWKYHEWVATGRPDFLLGEAQTYLRGVDLRWLEVANKGSVVYEKLTDKLLQRLELLAMRR
ncbi:hypothetical protein B0A55_00800 [Friedmanniomyces simplex]|uniref:F-box domain-containing protein n=1 Tax=Friedmanniomyces simplex TaxID=329884 RepID=A0A4U0Y4V8_9PEZI|nr:hypothetical protein B0A55_00800 [Friedmanniomyces simplex]